MLSPLLVPASPRKHQLLRGLLQSCCPNSCMAANVVVLQHMLISCKTPRTCADNVCSCFCRLPQPTRKLAV